MIGVDARAMKTGSSLLASAAIPVVAYTSANTGDGHFLIVVVVVAALASIGLVVWYIQHRKSSRPIPDLLFQPYSANKVTGLEPGAYDPLKFKLFKDHLSALSLGAGIEAPPIAVVRFGAGDIPMALAYCTDLGRESFNEMAWAERGVHVELKIEQPVLVVTEQLLATSLTGHEAEAIVANLLAKLILNPVTVVSTIGAGGMEWIEEQAKKLALDPGILTRARDALGDKAVALTVLLQDAWAVRLTSQPDALKSAIQKSHDLLSNTPVKFDMADPFVFVDPPHDWDYSRNILGSGPGYKDPYLTQRAAMGRDRDLIIQLRLASLEVIGRGGQAARCRGAGGEGCSQARFLAVGTQRPYQNKAAIPRT